MGEGAISRQGDKDMKAPGSPTREGKNRARSLHRGLECERSGNEA